MLSVVYCVFFFKQKTAYEMRISDWSSDVCSSDLGSVVVACATVDPVFALDLGKRLAERQILLIDAPISGGAARAAQGQLSMMTSGPSQAYTKVQAVLDAMAAKVYRLGEEHGTGSKVKIINQLLAGVHIAAAAEAMALGMREGVDPATLYDVITHSAGNSWMFENRVDRKSTRLNSSH